MGDPPFLHLPHDDMCDVGAGDGGHVLVAEVRDRAVPAGLWAVRQPGRSDEHPLQAAPSVDGLLPVLVGIDLTQQGRQEDAVVGEPAVAATVARAHPRDTEEASDARALHRIHDVSSALRQERDATQDQRRAEGTDHSVDALQRGVERCRCQHVSLHEVDVGAQW